MRSVLFALSSTTTFVFDRVTKIWAERALEFWSIPILGNTLQFRLAANEGIAFSLPLTGWPLKVITIGLIIFLGYFFFSQEEHRMHKGISLAYGALLGGALGNAYDRLFVGRVPDFIDLKYFAIFNGADIMVTISVAYILAFHVLYDRKP